MDHENRRVVFMGLVQRITDSNHQNTASSETLDCFHGSSGSAHNGHPLSHSGRSVVQSACVMCQWNTVCIQLYCDLQQSSFAFKTSAVFHVCPAFLPADSDNNVHQWSL